MDFAIRVGDWLSPFRISRIAISSCSDGLGVESLTDTNNPSIEKEDRTKAASPVKSKLRPTPTLRRLAKIEYLFSIRDLV